MGSNEEFYFCSEDQYAYTFILKITISKNERPRMPVDIACPLDMIGNMHPWTLNNMVAE